MFTIKKQPQYFGYTHSLILRALLQFRLIWGIFGNNDDFFPPFWFKPLDKQYKREFMWFFIRNPLHNFMFYVIGSADKQFIIYGMYPNDVFNPNGGWKYHFVYSLFYLPFVSYIGKFKFYIGWRERGNFGFKLTK